MKKVLILFLSSPLFLFAQINLKGKIIDASTRQVIPYVNLEYFKSKLGTQSNQDGVFELNLPSAKSTDTVKISCVGYSDKLITNLKPNINGVYELTPIVFQLKDVNIGKSKTFEKEIGMVKKKGRNITFFNQLIQRPGYQIAVFMNNENHKLAYIKKVHFYLGKEMYNAPFRVHIYDSEDSLPSNDLLNKSIEFAAINKNSWNELDISAYNLLVPENGFWVAVEWIKNEKYAAQSMSYDKKLPNGKYVKGTTFTYYGPEIIQRFDTEHGLTYRKYLGGKWQKNWGAKGIGTNKRDVEVDLMVKSTIQIVE